MAATDPARAPLPAVLIAALLAPVAGAQDAPGSPPDADAEVGSPLLEPFEPGSGSFTAQFGYYAHADDGDGNPFLDEELTVVEPVFVYDYDVSDDFGYGIQLSYDFVSSASIERLSKFPDQTGASADNYIGADFSFRHRLEDGSRVDWHTGYSVEYDYDSLGLGASYSWQPAGTDATVRLGLDSYLDSVHVIRFDGTEGGDESRTSFTGTASWYQVLSPSSFSELGLTFASQSGFLETPYNAVVIEDPMFAPNPNLDNLAQGIEVVEELPDSRTRLALHGRWRKRTSPGHAFELGGRLYSDSWGIQSLSFEPSYLKTLVTDRLHAQLRYRFYTQTAADDYREHFFLPDQSLAFKTQDSDLGDFQSNAVGLGLIWDRGDGDSINWGLDYALRSDGLDHWWTSIGWTWSF